MPLRRWLRSQFGCVRTRASGRLWGSRPHGGLRPHGGWRPHGGLRHVLRLVQALARDDTRPHIRDDTRPHNPRTCRPPRGHCSGGRSLLRCCVAPPRLHVFQPGAECPGFSRPPCGTLCGPSSTIHVCFPPDCQGGPTVAAEPAAASRVFPVGAPPLAAPRFFRARTNKPWPLSRPWGSCHAGGASGEAAGGEPRGPASPRWPPDMLTSRGRGRPRRVSTLHRFPPPPRRWRSDPLFEPQFDFSRAIFGGSSMASTAHRTGRAAAAPFSPAILDPAPRRASRLSRALLPA